jgi:tetratricopeptide (TPR) repeat protein
MASIWRNLNLDYLIIYNRTYALNINWITAHPPFNDLQFNVLIEIIADKKDKVKSLCDVAVVFSNHGKIDESITITKYIPDVLVKVETLMVISTVLFNRWEIDEASMLAEEAIEYLDNLNDISDDGYEKRISALLVITSELTKQEKENLASSFLRKTIDTAGKIKFNPKKDKNLKKISDELAILGKFDDAIICAQNIKDIPIKSIALKNISKELAQKGKLKEAASIIEKAIQIVCNVGDVFGDYSLALNEISSELAKQGRFKDAASVMQLALKCSRTLTRIAPWGTQGQMIQLTTQLDITKELLAQGDKVEAEKVMQEIFELANNISGDRKKSEAISLIALQLAKQKQNEGALCLVESITYDEYNKNQALSKISKELAKLTDIKSALDCLNKFSENYKDLKLRTLKEIYLDLGESGKIHDFTFVLNLFLESSHSIMSDHIKNQIIMDISYELAKLGMVKESLVYSNGLNSSLWNIKTLIKTATKLSKLDSKEKAEVFMRKAVECAENTNDLEKKDESFHDISIEFAEQSNFDEAFVSVRKISRDDGYMRRALRSISLVMAKQDQIESAIACAKNISDRALKCITLGDIAVELVKQRKSQEALEYTRDLSEMDKSSTLAKISTELSRQGEKNYASVIMADAIESAVNINFVSDKNRALYNIIRELTIQGKFEDSYKYLKSLSDTIFKGFAQIDIATELILQGNLKKAKEFSVGINSKNVRGEAFRKITTTIAKQGNWSMAEKISLEITVIEQHNVCWREIGANSTLKIGLKKTLDLISNLTYSDNKKYFFNGIANQVSVVECTNDIILKTIFHSHNNFDSMLMILNKYALNQLFFSNLPQEKLDRYNRTLNLQWAIDIKNQLPN